MSVQDILEVGEMAIDQDDFRGRYGVDVSRTISLVKLVFMQYQHPDLQQIKTFLKGKPKKLNI